MCYWDVRPGWFERARTKDDDDAMDVQDEWYAGERLIGTKRALRDDAMKAFGSLKLIHWVDDGVGTRCGAFRCREGERDWIIVVYRGTTPNVRRGLFKESSINARAGQRVVSIGDVRGRVHVGYAEAYEATRNAMEDVVRREMDSTGSSATKVVVCGHSLGGALATLCAAGLAKEYDDVECVTFGQPRVGDKEFCASLDAERKVKYARIVHGGDLFARVPTSGIWLPTSNEGRFAVEYAHAGSMFWTDATGVGKHAYSKKGEGEPDGFWTDTRMANPLRVANDHSGYARFLDDDSVEAQWPPSGLI